jgi:hypothetical protein
VLRVGRSGDAVLACHPYRSRVHPVWKVDQYTERQQREEEPLQRVEEVRPVVDLGPGNPLNAGSLAGSCLSIREVAVVQVQPEPFRVVGSVDQPRRTVVRRAAVRAAAALAALQRR